MLATKGLLTLLVRRVPSTFVHKNIDSGRLPVVKVTSSAPLYLVSCNRGVSAAWTVIKIRCQLTCTWNDPTGSQGLVDHKNLEVNARL